MESSMHMNPIPISMPNTQILPSLMDYPQPYQNPTLSGVPMPPNYHGPSSVRSHHPRLTASTTKAEKRKQEILTCDACGIEVNSQQMMDVHIRGQKHVKKMKLKAALVSDPVTPIDCKPEITETMNEPTQVPKAPESDGTPSTLTPSNSKPTIPADKSVLQTLNELAKHHKVAAKYDLINETGPPHCKQFEVRLTLAEETYSGTGTSIKRAQQVAAEQALANTALKKPEPGGARANHGVRSGRGRTIQSPPKNQENFQPSTDSKPLEQNSILDKFENLLRMRCVEVTEPESTLILIRNLIETIERALKTVSDKIMQTYKTDNIRVTPRLPDETSSEDEDVCESYRMLKGSMKVSLLSMDLLLKTDREYCLALICVNKPSEGLLKEVGQELNIALSAQAIAQMQLESDGNHGQQIVYQVEENLKEAALIVRCSLLPDRHVRILFTSPIFRNENFLHLNEQQRQQIDLLNPDPSDMLDKSKCLATAAKIRHSNWFGHCMMENKTNTIVIRLLRSLQQNQTPLSLLDLWTLILVVYKCQYRPEHSIVHLFRLVFAYLSGGALLTDGFGPGIADPCEMHLVHVAGDLTLQQRLSITSYAQTVLRHIAFEQYDQIFVEPSYQTALTVTQSETMNFQTE